MEYLERAFLREKNLKPRAPPEGIHGEDGPPRRFEVSLVLGSIRGGGFGVWDLGRGRACEGEGELKRERERVHVRVRGSVSCEGERERVRSLFNDCVV